MKVFDAHNTVAIESFVSELQAHNALQEVQGSVIPVLHSFGWMHHTGCPAIVTYWAGSTVTGADFLSNDMLAAAEQGLQAMHSSRVSHGDVRLSNMWDNDRLVFCDFGQSVIDASPHDCQQDFAMLAQVEQ